MRPDVDGPAELADRVVEDSLALMALCFERKAGDVAGGEGSAETNKTGKAIQPCAMLANWLMGLQTHVHVPIGIGSDWVQTEDVSLLSHVPGRACPVGCVNSPAVWKTWMIPSPGAPGGVGKWSLVAASLSPGLSNATTGAPNVVPSRAAIPPPSE